MGHFIQVDNASGYRGASGVRVLIRANTVEQIKGLETLILQLREKETQRTKEILGLKREIYKQKKLIETENASRKIYASVLKSTVSTRTAKAASPTQFHKLRAEDDKCSITINTTRVEGEKKNFVQVKAALQHSKERRSDVCWKLSGERINVVLTLEEGA